jgi:hypothetical protein
MKRKIELTKELVNIDESVREIASLAELYDELLESAPKGKRELDLKKDEAKFARDRILKLSLHVKNEAARVEGVFR